MAAGIRVLFLPEPRALNSVGEQIRATGNAYPLFSLAKMFLDKPERHLIQLEAHSSQDETHFFQCSICRNVTLDREGMAIHVLKKHRPLFYEEQREAMEPPKGNFSSVARCKLNGTLLGPTNHHAYQANLMRLYKTHYRHLPFEQFKENIVSVHDPEVVKKWKEEVSWQTTFKCLHVSEAGTLHSETEMEQHFLQTHFKTVVTEGRRFVVEGETIRQAAEPRLVKLVRQAWEEEDRFPLHLAGRLRADFFKMGLQVFKGKKGMQYVSAARPRPLAANQANVSGTICAILEFICGHPGKDRKAVLEAVAGAGTAANNVLQDLHWLIRQGHVIEYHDKQLELARSVPSRKKTAARPSAQAGTVTARPSPDPVPASPPAAEAP